MLYLKAMRQKRGKIMLKVLGGNNMKLEVGKLKNMDIEQISSIITPSILKLQEKYSYAMLKKIEYSEIIREGITLGLKRISKLESYKTIDTDFLSKEINLVINSYIGKKVLKEETALIIFNNFINQNIKSSQDYSTNMKQFKKFSNFLKRIKNTPDKDLYIELIKSNQILNSILSQIVNKNLEAIKNGELYNVIDDDFLIAFIEAYCIINNIKMKEKEIDLDNIYEEIEKKQTKDYESLDSIKLYLNEIDKPLLTKEEEQQLGYAILDGDEEAKKILIERSLKLVVSIAARYCYRACDFLDLIQDGNEGLIKAADRFDVTKGFKFSTYATWWIRQKIIRSIQNTSRNIRIPVRVNEAVTKYKKTYNELELKLGREPSKKELASALNFSLEKIEELDRIKEDTLSINNRTSEETEYQESIPDKKTNIENECIDNVLVRDVRKALENSGLKLKDLSIITLYFGLNGEESLSLEDIGKKYGTSRQNIQKIQKRVFRDLSKSKEWKRLAVYIGKQQDDEKSESTVINSSSGKILSFKSNTNTDNEQIKIKVK